MKQCCLVWVLILGLMAALAAGCGSRAPEGGVRPAPSPDVEASNLVNLGRERLAGNRPQDAADAFNAALKLARDPMIRQEASLGMAQAEEGQGLYQNALNRLTELRKQGMDASLAVDAEILSARLLVRLDRPAEALAILEKLLNRPAAALSLGQWRLALDAMAQVHQSQGNFVKATEVLMRLAAQEGPQTARYETRLMEVASEARSEDIEALQPRAQTAGSKAALGVALSRALTREGRLARAKEVLAGLAADPAAQPFKWQMEAVRKDMAEAGRVNNRAVGVILPRTGPYAVHGERVLAAVELGLGVYTPGGNAPTLFIEDSRGDARSAAEAVQRLVTRNKVMAIIGPMGAAPALAAARQANQMSVPILTLSQVEGVTAGGEYAFQNFVTPGDQVDALLDEVMGRRGLTRMAVMAPKNSYGLGFAKLMAQRIAARGGSYVRDVYYAPDSTDFTADVQRLVKLPPGNYRPGLPDSPRPVIDFQALFVPDGPTRVAMLSPQLVYFDVVTMPLLGTSLWHSPTLAREAGRYLDRSLFPDAFDPASGRTLVREFVADFREAMGQEPTQLEAQGYDAGLIVRSILNSPEPPQTREQVRDALARLSGLVGVCGPMSMGQDRRVIKPMQLFTVRGESFVRVGGPEPSDGESPAAPGAPAFPAAPGQDPGDVPAAESPATPAYPGAAPSGETNSRLRPLTQVAAEAKATPAPLDETDPQNVGVTVPDNYNQKDDVPEWARVYKEDDKQKDETVPGRHTVIGVTPERPVIVPPAQR